MGHKTYQRILECDECGITPDDGEPMWEMGGVHWCEACCDKDDEKLPTFRYEVKYLDNMHGDSVRTAEVEAPDEGEALDTAIQEDYYFGILISVTELGEVT